jgi:hypothetical protein
MLLAAIYKIYSSSKQGSMAAFDSGASDLVRKSVSALFQGKSLDSRKVRISIAAPLRHEHIALSVHKKALSNSTESADKATDKQGDRDIIASIINSKWFLNILRLIVLLDVFILCLNNTNSTSASLSTIFYFDWIISSFYLLY